MQSRLPVLVATLALVLSAGCASPSRTGAPSSPLVGAWLVTSARSCGVGKNMLTFSSDGTFFRSGDTHPNLSGGHGAWKQVGAGEFEATYIAFRFDENRKWIGSTKTTLRITLGDSPNEFKGTARSVTRDLDDKPLRDGGAQLEGSRIVVDSH